MSAKIPRPCTICGQLHERVGRGISALGKEDVLICKQPDDVDRLALKVLRPPTESFRVPPFRCAWIRAAQLHSRGLLDAGIIITEISGGNPAVGVLTSRRVAVISLTGSLQIGTPGIWIGLVDDGDGALTLLVGGCRISGTGFFNQTWLAVNRTLIPYEIPNGSQAGIAAALRSAIRAVVSGGV